MQHQTDFLVIGSGIAGLSFALKAAKEFPKRKVTVVTKADPSESNTRYAQGGIAAVMDRVHDSYEKHIEDTLKAGDGLCKQEIVEMVVKEGPQRLQELIDIGTEFDKTTTGDYDLGKEGGHTARRIIHHKDITGFEMERALLKQVHNSQNIELLDHHFAIDLITQHHLGEEVTRRMGDIKCFGAYVMDLKTTEIETCVSRITLLASGGGGQVYAVTTNPPVATADGIAMAYRAKAWVDNLEFVQFHPTALYNPGESPAFLISEAVRGFGAILKTKDGEEFVNKYDGRGSLASRDIVARAIDAEMKAKGDSHVYLDCREQDIKAFKEHFPNIYEKCLSLSIDVAKDMIPVVPAAHYLCGGVRIDEFSRTSIENLYCAGETSCSGLHGANRLASNSLLEALVFAHKCFLDASEKIDKVESRNDIPEWDAEGTTRPRELVLITHNRRELQEVMSDYVGIVRTNQRLQRALTRLEILYKETEQLYDTSILSPQICELRNMINVAYLIITQSIARKENKGAYFNLDNQAVSGSDNDRF